jgi:hypothetical protein
MSLESGVFDESMLGKLNIVWFNGDMELWMWKVKVSKQ